MFLKQVKHWFIARANAARWRPIHDWAESRQGQFRLAKDGRGFLIEQPKAMPGSLRIEWGASQRAYIEGTELRMRCELRLHSDLQMMILCRQLMEVLERTVFEAYTDTLKTRVDTDTPEEMRWLVMFPKVTTISSKLVRQRFGALGVNKTLAADWLEGELSEILAQASQDLLPEGHPFVLMTMRGNVYLRTAMTEPTLPKIQALVRVLESACREALRINGKLSERGPWPTTTSVAWHSSTPDEDVPQN
ncbi:MAG: hypothetical protein K2W93_04695 [Burkholderiaceae bacterium]|uniref:hypothetical protein n=1 Tax=Paucibacter sp. KCTC 42545 TaxID=1768242 RepID=UPI000733A745|nr:hypothetical protein [Paucibacter sp. KCTC 42545]ALT76937.1 hypothetical protein AT984_06795 [Paucibacter sp. KCTC 42545]MBY0234256.1 hypothetical protein [Burkholderiaceae bacterium]